MALEEVLVVAVGVFLLATPTLPYEEGAPFGACSTMTPGHGAQPTTPSPYSISLSAITYKPGNTITVTVTGGTFLGIMMQVRKVGTDKRHGTWSNLAADTRTQTCTNEADTVTHLNINPKQDATFTWTPPDDFTDDLQVVATVAQEKIRWWKGLTSATLTFDTPTTTPTSTTTTTTTTTATTTPTSTTPTTTASGLMSTAGIYKYGDNITQAIHTLSTSSVTPSIEGTTTVYTSTAKVESSASSIFTIFVTALTAVLALRFH